MTRPRYTIGWLMRATLAVALGLGLLRGLGLDAGLPVLSSLILGRVAWSVCRRRWEVAPILIGLAYLLVPAWSVVAGTGTMDFGWLVLGTVLAYPTVLGAGMGSWAASKHLPPRQVVAAYDDLILIVTVLPLVIVGPAVAWFLLIALNGLNGFGDR